MVEIPKVNNASPRREMGVLAEWHKRSREENGIQDIRRNYSECVFVTTTVLQITLPKV